MTELELKLLVEEFGEDLKIEDAKWLHDEKGYNYSCLKVISYKGIVCGSDLVSYDFVRENILEVNA
jgi:hypothetical protein